MMYQTPSDGRQTVEYTYSTTAPSVGKLVKVESNVSTTEYTGFDILGRVTAHKQTTDGNQYTTGYTYSLSGALLEQTYPSGRVVKNTYDAADGSLSQVQSKRSSETYRNFANGFIYSAAGAVTAMRLGNGKWENTVFNSRMQPTQIGLGNGVNSQNLLKLDYEYGATASVNNGNVTKQTITVPGMANPFIQQYTYDELNRLKDATETQNSTQTWKQTFTFDRYGNRNFDEANTTFAGFDKLCNGNTTLCSDLKKRLNPTINTSNNRLSTSDDYAFDSSCNTTADAEGRTFVYDAENKQVEVIESSVTIGEYFYDGDGKRVKKIAGSEETIFVYDARSILIGEYSTTPAQEPSLTYITTDSLGSPRILTDAVGAVISRRDFHPFGEEISTAARTSNLGYSVDEYRQKFTTYERDEEIGLDYAQARYYSDSLGRFTTIDPLRGSGIRYVPQSWNRYSYCLNQPTRLVDPTGLIWLTNGDGNFHWVDDDYYKTEEGQKQWNGYQNANGSVMLFERRWGKYAESAYDHLQDQYVSLNDDGSISLAEDPNNEVGEEEEQSSGFDFNPTKAISAGLTAANSGRLFASGFTKLVPGAVAALNGPSPEEVVTVPVAAWGVWNLSSGWTNHKRSRKLFGEAAKEKWSDASWKNLYGPLPFGDQYDDPGEPSFREFWVKKGGDFYKKPIEFISEIGTVF